MEIELTLLERSWFRKLKKMDRTTIIQSEVNEMI